MNNLTNISTAYATTSLTASSITNDSPRLYDAAMAAIKDAGSRQEVLDACHATCEAEKRGVPLNGLVPFDRYATKQKETALLYPGYVSAKGGVRPQITDTGGEVVWEGDIVKPVKNDDGRDITTTVAHERASAHLKGVLEALLSGNDA